MNRNLLIAGFLLAMTLIAAAQNSGVDGRTPPKKGWFPLAGFNGGGGAVLTATTPSGGGGGGGGGTTPCTPLKLDFSSNTGCNAVAVSIFLL